jgi:hypothetical protein
MDSGDIEVPLDFLLREMGRVSARLCQPDLADSERQSLLCLDRLNQQMQL